MSRPDRARSWRGLPAGLAVVVLACGARAGTAASLDTLIATGRDFLAESAARSRGAAIRSFAAGGAIAFLPAPVGVARLAGDPGLANGRREGAIAYAEMSGNADLGVLLGPAIAGAPGGAPQRADWLTVWLRPAGGEWRVWLDGQTIVGPTDGDLGDVRLERGPEHAPIPVERAPGPGLLGYGSSIGFGVAAGGGGVGIGVGFGGGGGGPVLSGKTQIDREVAHFTNALLTTERSWMFDRFNRDVRTSLARHASDDVRVMRDGHPMAHGAQDAAQVIGDPKGTYSITQTAHRISSSYQVAASYGTLRFKASGAARPDTVAFMHVWGLLPDGKYRLIVSLENSLAQRTAGTR